MQVSRENSIIKTTAIVEEPHHFLKMLGIIVKLDIGESGENLREFSPPHDVRKNVEANCELRSLPFSEPFGPPNFLEKPTNKDIGMQPKQSGLCDASRQNLSGDKLGEAGSEDTTGNATRTSRRTKLKTAAKSRS